MVQLRSGQDKVRHAQTKADAWAKHSVDSKQEWCNVMLKSVQINLQCCSCPIYSDCISSRLSQVMRRAFTHALASCDMTCHGHTAVQCEEDCQLSVLCLPRQSRRHSKLQSGGGKAGLCHRPRSPIQRLCGVCTVPGRARGQGGKG